MLSPFGSLSELQSLPPGQDYNSFPTCYHYNEYVVACGAVCDMQHTHNCSGTLLLLLLLLLHDNNHNNNNVCTTTIDNKRV